MSNTLEKYDEDIQWLRNEAEKTGRRPTDAQEESFAERVSFITADGVDEDDARKTAFKGLS